MNSELKYAAPAGVNENEPSSSSEAVPVWLFLLIGLLFFSGAYYLDTRSGNYDVGVFAPYPDTKYLADIQPKDEAEAMRSHGRKVFEAVCSQCHQTTGLGVAGQFPPLAGSEWVLAKSPERVIHVALYGLAGPVTVKGQGWNAAMPNMGESTGMSNDDLAAVVTYIRSAWGNTASPASPEEVAAVRKKQAGRAAPMSEADLKAMPE